MIEVTPPKSAAAEVIVRAYMSDVASSFYGRQASLTEIERALHDEPSDGLCGDTGVFLTAVAEGATVACAGARFVEGAAELTKVFTLPGFRGRGIGTRLIEELEVVCRDRGIRTVRLDTRADLTEACALYERLGFFRAEAFNGGAYSDRWYSKAL